MQLMRSFILYATSIHYASYQLQQSKLINKRANFHARKSSSSINGSVVSKQCLESTYRHIYVHAHHLVHDLLLFLNFSGHYMQSGILISLNNSFLPLSMNLLMLFELQGRKIKSSHCVSQEFLTYFVLISSHLLQKCGNCVRRIYTIRC